MGYLVTYLQGHPMDPDSMTSAPEQCCPFCGSTDFFTPAPKERWMYNYTARKMERRKFFYSFCRECKKNF